MERLTLESALDDPDGAARAIDRDLMFVAVAVGFHEFYRERASSAFGVVHRVGATFLLKIRPAPALKRDGYPMDYLRVRVGPGDLYSIDPIRFSASKSFKHRNPNGTLCLEMPDDPPERRWSRDDGLQSLVFSGARHMWFEEANRRTGKWPIEDAPHGYSSEVQ